MNNLKLLMILMLVLILVSCSGRSVKSLIQEDSKAVTIETTQNEDQQEVALEQLPDDVETSSEEIGDPELPVNDDQSVDPITSDSTSTNVPEEQEASTLPDEQVTVPTAVKPKVEETIVIIQSENQYTDEEKAKLLKEIDELLDETLKDITDLEVEEQLDNLVEGGQ